jgi:NDP-sugar pyrophosphorylase family protein
MNVTGLVLAAGFGTRLRPSTQYCPKPLIPVAGVEPLFHALFQMQKVGIRDVIVNAHYLADQIERALLRWKELLPELRIVISREDPAILGTGGAIHKVLREHPELFKGRGLLVLNGDTLAAFDLSPLMHSKQETSCFAISQVAEHLKKYKPLWVDKRGQWVGIGPQAPAVGALSAHFLGIHYLCPRDVASLIENIPEKIEEIDLFNGVYRPLANSGAIFMAHVVMKERQTCDFTPTNFWFDMTNTEFLLEAQRFVLEHLSQGSWWSKVLVARHPRIRERSPGVWVDGDAALKCRFLRPAVFVEDIEGALERKFGDLELGPHASMVHDMGRLRDGDASLPPIRISNSVVLVSREAPESALPAEIHDEIRVL